MVSRGLDKAAVAAVRGRGVEGAAHPNRVLLGEPAVFHPAQQQNLAVSLLDSPGPDQPLIVDHRAGQLPRHPGGHQHPAAVGAELAEVLHPGPSGKARLIHRQADQLIPLQIEGKAVAGGESHLAEPGLDHPGVCRVITGQDDITALRRLKQPLVDHLGIRQPLEPAETIATGQEIIVGDIMGGGEQAVDADLGPGGEEDPVGVDQKDLAVGLKLAENLAGVGPGHPVEGDAACPRLLEADQLWAGDGKTVPVDDRLVALLADPGGAGIGAADACYPGDHLLAGRTGPGRQGGKKDCRRQERVAGDDCACRPRATVPLGDLGGNVPTPLCLAPYKSIGPVHALPLFSTEPKINIC